MARSAARISRREQTSLGQQGRAPPLINTDSTPGLRLGALDEGILKNPLGSAKEPGHVAVGTALR